jgi:hypothetical protein
MSEKQALLSALTASYEELFSSIMGLQDEHMTLPMLEDWSAKDILAHIAGWGREIAVMLERMAAGQRARAEGIDYSDVDGWNARFVEEARDLSPTEVLTALHAAHDACVRAAEALPEERFAEGRTAERLLREWVIDHYDEHAAQIWAWRDGLEDEALGRYGEVLRPHDPAGQSAAGEG